MVNDEASQGAIPPSSEPPVYSLFDLDEWPVHMALWLFGTGNDIPADFSTADVGLLVKRQKLEKLDAMGRRHSWPAPFIGVLRHYIRLPTTTPEKYQQRALPHDWIRFALQSYLPISLEFWHSFYRWKAARWHKGYEVVQPYVMVKAEGQAVARPLEEQPLPAELLWHVPLTYEKNLGANLSGDVAWLHFWRLHPGALLDAVETSRLTHYSRTGDNPAKRLQRLREAGSGKFVLIADAVDRLGAEMKVKKNDVGRYEFRLQRAETIALLRKVAPELIDVPDSTLKKALPGLVVGMGRGRPPKRR